MMTHPLGRLIRSRRAVLHITQDALATALDVDRSLVHKWESGDRTVALTHIPRLAELLGVREEQLHALVDVVPRLRAVPVSDRVSLDPVKCAIDDMYSLGPMAQRLHDLVLSKIGEGPFDELRHKLLRDTRWELLLGFSVLADTAGLLWTSPLEAGSRVFVPGSDKRSYEGHLLRLAIAWERDGEKMVFFPQVCISVPKTDNRYRVDYLVVQSRPGELPKNVVVELDDRGHEMRTVKDAERVEDLHMSVVRFDNRATLAPEFLPALLRAIRERADFLRVNDTEYARFVERRRKGADELRQQRSA